MGTRLHCDTRAGILRQGLKKTMINMLRALIGKVGDTQNRWVVEAERRKC